MPVDPGSQNGNREYDLRPEAVLTSLDPELQNVLILHESGHSPPFYLREKLNTGEEVVDVIARLRNPKKQVKGLIVSQYIGAIVTGMVKASDIVAVRKNRNVLSLKGARRVRPTVASSVPEIRASRHQLRNAIGGLSDDIDGAGVIVGIVDLGCDFIHRNFRTADGKTRIRYLWDQRGGTHRGPEGYGGSPRNFGYGREFCADALNEALRCEDPRDPEAPFQAIGYDLENVHGAAVMDVAAGNGGRRHARGVAPEADIIFVHSSLGRESETSASIGNSRHLLEAVKYIFDRAYQLRMSAAVNISLNSDGGPHDGTTPVEQGFEQLLQTSGRAIVIAAGNRRDAGTHVNRVVHPKQSRTLFWKIAPGDKTDNKLEIWYSGHRRLEVTVRPPNQPSGQNPLGPVLPGSTQTIIRRTDGKTHDVGRIFNRLNDSGNGDNHIAIFLEPAAGSGVWEVILRSPDEFSAPIDFHAWIERDDDGSSVFDDVRPSDRAYTVGTIACGQSTFAVSGYNVFDPGFIPGFFAEGPTRDGKLKPDVSAPGQELFVAEATTEDGTDEISGPSEGSSLAAPHVTGLIALLMQVAPRRLTTEEIRKFVIDTARRNPPGPAEIWDPRYGAGRINASAALFECVRSIRPAVTFIEETHELVVHETIASPGPNPGSIAIHEITAAGISETTSLSFSPAVSEGVVEASAPDDTDFALPNTQGHLA